MNCLRECWLPGRAILHAKSEWGYLTNGKWMQHDRGEGKLSATAA